MIVQNIQSYRKETRNTDTSLRSCTGAYKGAAGTETKGMGANSMFESASSRLPVHKQTVTIRPLERWFMCCFHMGHRPQWAPASPVRHIHADDAFKGANPSSLGCRSVDIHLNFAQSHSAISTCWKSHLQANWRGQSCAKVTEGSGGSAQLLSHSPWWQLNGALSKSSSLCTTNRA